MLYFNNKIGRLGNQLFIYAFALHLQDAYGVSYVLSNIEELRYFRLRRTDLLNRLKGYFFFHILSRLFKVGRLDLTDQTVAYSTVASKLLNGHYRVTGFFQYPKYFVQHTKEIKTAFKIKSKYRDRFVASWQDVLDSHYTVAVHIRRSDYKEHNIQGLGGPDYRLPMSYYIKALSQWDRPKETLYIIVGDDYDFMEREFAFVEKKIVSKSTAIVDLQILMHVKECVISNSTFSWWGAFLNVNKDRKIFCPRFFLGFKANIEYPSGIYPDDWVQVSVYD